MMNTKMSLRILQIVLGVVLFLYSAELVMEQPHAAHDSPASFALLVLASVEAVAALVFLFCDPDRGPALLMTFAVAGMFHILHGQPGELGVLLIYAAGVFAVMSGKRVERAVADGR